MAIRAGLEQRQSASLSPEHILGKATLKMGLQELQQFVQTQFAENPALTIEECAECPACHSILVDDICPTCGSRELSEEDKVDYDEYDWDDDFPRSATEPEEPYPEQFAGVATPSSLTDDLKQQIRATFPEKDRALATFIVDCLDEDGYLREPLLDIANHFGRSVPETEVVLKSIQDLDPAGIAARDLRECLLLQISRLDADSDERRLAESLIRGHWDLMSRMRLDEVAKKMKTSRAKVEAALRFVQENLTPHPAAAYRDPWQDFAPRRVPRTAPDVVVRLGDSGLETDVADPISGNIAIDQVYTGLYAEMSAKNNGYSDSDRAHVREFVAKAKSVIEALEFRKSTLRKITSELAKSQAAFFAEGPSALKPMTRKELARKLGIHESTVCRATQDKTIRLPSGDVISFDVLFDSALPIKEMVRRLASRRLSDGEIAKKLNEAGVQIARRTVAKYRDQLRVLPLDYRLAA